jgi:hypothetical protein
VPKLACNAFAIKQVDGKLEQSVSCCGSVLLFRRSEKWFDLWRLSPSFWDWRLFLAWQQVKL